MVFQIYSIMNNHKMFSFSTPIDKISFILSPYAIEIHHTTRYICALSNLKSQPIILAWLMGKNFNASVKMYTPFSKCNSCSDYANTWKRPHYSPVVKVNRYLIPTNGQLCRTLVFSSLFTWKRTFEHWRCILFEKPRRPCDLIVMCCAVDSRHLMVTFPQ